MQCIQEFNGFHGKVFIFNVQITHCRLGNSLCLDWNCPTLCWSKIQEDSGWQENKKPAETTQRSSNWTEGLGAQLFSTGLLQRSLGAGQQENGTGKVHWTDRISSTWARPDAHWQCVTYVCRKQKRKGSAAGPVSLPARQAALAKTQRDTREQGSLSPEMPMQGLFM